MWDSDDNNIAIGNGSGTQVFFSDDKGSDLASATTLTAANGHYYHVTGTTTVTGISSKPAGLEIILYFEGAVPLTHNATSFILRSGQSRTTVAGDIVRFISEGSGNWREVSTGVDPTKVLAVDQAVSSASTGTTLVDATGMTTEVVANAKYRVDIGLTYTAGTSGDFKGGFICSATGATANIVFQDVETTWATNVFTGNASPGVTRSADGAGATTPSVMYITGFLYVSSTAGTFKIQFAQATSNGTATTLLAGSYMTLTRLV